MKNKALLSLIFVLALFLTVFSVSAVNDIIVDNNIINVTGNTGNLTFQVTVNNTGTTNLTVYIADFELTDVNTGFSIGGEKNEKKYN